MNNNLNLTDDELSLIATSLQMTIMGHEKYVSVNGEAGLDYETKQGIEEMKILFERLNREYF